MIKYDTISTLLLFFKSFENDVKINEALFFVEIQTEMYYFTSKYKTSYLNY